MYLRPIIAAILIFSSIDLVADLQKASFVATVTREVQSNYLVFEPVAKKPWPMILFLHGAGERAEEIENLCDLGPMGYARRNPGVPFLVAMPHCDELTDWDPLMLMALIDELCGKYPIDEDRIYLTGFSMGGAGTWELAMDHPGRFAAIAPVCGRAIPLLVGRLWRKPVWIFHGEKDEVVPVDISRKMAEYLESMGNTNVRLTVYPDEGHHIWERVYNDPGLYKWCLEHRLKEESE